MFFRFIPRNIDFIRYSIYALSFNFFIIVLATVLLVSKGIYCGLDFTGGIEIEVTTEQGFNVENALKLNGFQIFSLQKIDNSRNVMIRLKSEKNIDQAVVIKKIKDILGSKVSYRKIDYVGPQIGEKQLWEGIIAILCAFVGIFTYIWIRFGWIYGIGGVIALLHDVFITMAFISLLRIEFDLTSVAALLTIIGYSINDTVVIYDRIRLLCKKESINKLKEIINIAINSTLSRTMLTSGSTLLSTIPLILLTKGSVRDLSLIIFVGVLVGTYSSIFISAPLLLVGEKNKAVLD